MANRCKDSPRNPSEFLEAGLGEGGLGEEWLGEGGVGEVDLHQGGFGEGRLADGDWQKGTGERGLAKGDWRRGVQLPQAMPGKLCRLSVDGVQNPPIDQDGPRANPRVHQ